MKKIFFVLISLHLFIYPSTSHSNGYTLLDIGGNLSTPTESNPASIYWNPGAMGWDEKNQIMMDFAGFYSWVQYANPDRDAVETKGLFFIPFLGGNYTIPLKSSSLNSLSTGFAIYLPYGVEAHFPENGFQRYIIVDGVTALFSFSPALSLKMFNIFSIGFAFNAGMGLLTATGSTYISDYTKPDEEIKYEMKNLTGWGFGFSAGLFASPHPLFDVGISWSSPLSVNHRGKISLSGTSLSENNLRNLYGTSSVSARVSAKIDYPWYLNAGIRFKPLRFVEFNLIFQFYHWDSFEDIPLHLTDGVSKETGQPVDLDPIEPGTDLKDSYRTGFINSLTFRLDMRYRGKRTVLCVGTGYDDSGIPDKYLSPMNLEFDKIQFLFGAEYKVWKNLITGIGFNHYIPFKRKISNSRLDVPANGTYRANGDRFNLTLRYEI